VEKKKFSVGDKATVYEQAYGYKNYLIGEATLKKKICEDTKCPTNGMFQIWLVELEDGETRPRRIYYKEPTNIISRPTRKKKKKVK